jgi:type III secretory pathway component EscS
MLLQCITLPVIFADVGDLKYWALSAFGGCLLAPAGSLAGVVRLRHTLALRREISLASVVIVMAALGIVAGWRRAASDLQEYGLSVYLWRTAPLVLAALAGWAAGTLTRRATRRIRQRPALPEDSKIAPKSGTSSAEGL